MRAWRTAILPGLAWLGLALVCLCVRAQAPDPQPMVTVRQAQAWLVPDGAASKHREVTLSYRWDADYPGRDGFAEFHLDLPPPLAPGPQALLLTRTGNQFEVLVKNAVIYSSGTLGNPRHDASKAPHLVRLTSGASGADGAAPVRVTVRETIQHSRWGGLSAVLTGSEGAVRDEYERLRLWRQTLPTIFAAVLLMMSLVALAIWRRLRDPLFGCFAATAFLGFVRNLERVWADVPLPWPLVGIISSTAYAWHLALMCLFALLAVGIPLGRLRWVMWAYAALSLVLITVSFGWGVPWLWNLALILLVPFALYSVAVLVRDALGQRNGPRTRVALLAVVGLVAVVAGLHDLGWVRLRLGATSRFSVTPHAMFLFVVFMAALIVERYTSTVAAVRSLNDSLEDRVKLKERELAQAFERLELERTAAATSQERQRIMRDLHDGVGAHLVGLLALVKGGSRQDLLEDHVNAALDEMRLAIDSMQLNDAGLDAALATLRWRLQPRLLAAGLEVDWPVAELPADWTPPPQAVLQLQRIVLEALSNVIKHAKARRVEVVFAAADAQVLELRVCDDGLGLPPQPGKGHGLRSMRERALALGAELSLDAGPQGHGLCVRLRWPLAPAKPQAA